MNEYIKKISKEIKKASDIIKKAIDDRSMIILRHHADCDGYCGALVLEEVILPIIEKENLKPWQKYRRISMKTPFYSYSDALKDITLLKQSIEKGKKPLLILVDNGCAGDDLLGIQRIKQHNIDVVVIDHHVYSEEVQKLSDGFVNARTVGDNGDVTSGMLAFEVAKFIGKPKNIYPAVSAIGDRSKEEIADVYIKQAGKKREFLEKISICVDFEGSNIFTENETIYDLFNENQEKTLRLLLPEINKKIEEAKVVARKYLKKERIGRINVFWLDLDKTFNQGDFPIPGKFLGIAHRMQTGQRVSLGTSSNLITFRADDVNFKINDILKRLKNKIPYGKISGGGHNFAGGIRYIPAAKEEVIREIKNYLRGL